MKNSIADLRAHYRLSQGQLADKIHVSRRTITYIENSNYEPSIQTAYKLSKFFNKPIEYLFDLTYLDSEVEEDNIYDI